LYRCGPHCLFDKPASSARLYHSRLQASGGLQPFYAAKRRRVLALYTPRRLGGPVDANKRTDQRLVCWRFYAVSDWRKEPIRRETSAPNAAVIATVTSL